MPVSDVNAMLLHSVVERCRALVEKSGVLSAESRVLVTISVGATLIVNGDSTEFAIKRADQLMYLSKANGRNRTTVGRLAGWCKDIGARREDGLILACCVTVST